MILLSHPVGNEFARAVLAGLEQAGMLAGFHTTVAFHESDFLVRFAPERVRRALMRRSFGCPDSKTFTHPLRELVRLAAPQLGASILTAHESGWASMDAVCRDLDLAVASHLRSLSDNRNRTGGKAIAGAYCYEDASYHTFQAAKQLGVKCLYDLPIAYWQTSQRLLREEADRLPDWEPTLGGTRDSEAKLERKTAEAEMADLIVCPSQFVYDSLPEEVREAKRTIIAQFGSPPAVPDGYQRQGQARKPLRVLFVGAMTQRKGLSDLFEAWKILGRSDLELVVMGAPVAPMSFYRSRLSNFTYESPRPHNDVLKLMQTCDVLVLPSIVEGRALVQQEALVCGLPLVVTANAGGQDLIEEGRTGFLVPIRSPEKIAERINWFADNRGSLEEMSMLSRLKAAGINWDTYQTKILSAIRKTVGGLS